MATWVHERVHHELNTTATPQAARESLKRAAQAVAQSTYDGRLDWTQYRLGDADLTALIAESVQLGVARHTRVLDLFYNNLSTVPEAVASAFASLEELLLGCNPLNRLSRASLPAGLQLLDVGYSESLTHLPDDIFEGLQQLRELRAGCNQLQRLPASLFDADRGCASSLEHLEVYGNRLAELPDSIGNLRRLRVLNLGRNQLQMLPRRLAELPALHVLQLYDNDLRLPLPTEYASADAFPQLRELVWRGNVHLPSVPRECERLGARQVLRFWAST